MMKRGYKGSIVWHNIGKLLMIVACSMLFPLTIAVLYKEACGLGFFIAVASYFAFGMDLGSAVPSRYTGATYPGARWCGHCYLWLDFGYAGGYAALFADRNLCNGDPMLFLSLCRDLPLLALQC